ncbi:MAG: metalloregulator ArsR/SmtB family transcription factor [Alphaproteobacteria bacterium]|nr:metalloregulator ArsR/SmtB family transcription factor [Alphaproteobacteria bacterium]
MESLGLPTLVQQLRAAGELTRARILALLARGELSVGELAQVLGQSQPRLSRHMKFLTTAGLVDRLPEGAWVFYRLPFDGQARTLVDTLIASLDADDATVRRDVDRLHEVRATRTASAQDYFSRIAGDWDAIRALHYSETDIEDAILAAAGPGPFDLVLDFGTGTGRMLTLFAPRAQRVEGIDLSHQMLTVARSNLLAAGAANASVRHGDASATPYPDACASLVIIHQVLHFLDDPGRALSEAARVLKPGGRLVVADFAPHTLEHFRNEHAHRHLGVSEEDFSRWATAAKLAPGPVRRFSAPAHGKGVAVTIWTAEREPVRKAGRAA